MAIGVERSYTSDDTAALWSFVRDGGNIIIADDFGHGSSLWAKGGFNEAGEVEFYKKQLYDIHYVKNTKFVWVDATLDYELNYVEFTKQYNLLLNEPSALRIKSYDYPNSYYYRNAQSSEDSWLDDNDNGVRDPAEKKQAYDMILSISSPDFKGKVIVISDPGLFINDNWNRMDNAEFVQDIIYYLLPEGGQVIFDESRHLNENTFENSRHVLYSGLVYLTSSFWIVIIIAFVIISGTLVIGAKIKPQKQWRNRNLLKIKHLNNLIYPHLSSSDYSQMYNAFLEKVRLGYGYNSKEFRYLEYNTLYNLIGDRYLWDFITQRFPAYPDENYYKFVTRNIIDWSPRHPDELKADSEKFKDQNKYRETGEYDYYSDRDNDYEDYSDFAREVISRPEAVEVEPIEHEHQYDNSYRVPGKYDYYENEYDPQRTENNYDNDPYRDRRKNNYGGY
jgi:hypothetical protein